MGYYIKHIVSINEDSTKDKLKQIQEVIEEMTDFNFALYDDHLDDSNWNFGSGLSHFDDEYIWANVSEKLPDIDFTVHCFSESNAIYDYHCFNGYTTDVIYRNPDEWYKMYQDVSLRAPGANKGYYDDPGYGDNYKFNYGDSTIPAGVVWWNQ